MKHTLIIAEAGINHNGSLETAKKLALVAKECGADIVKYQTAKLDSLVSKAAPMADYQSKNMNKTVSQKEMLANVLLSFEEFRELFSYCKEIGIYFLSTPFDLESIEFLEELGCDMWKIPSGEITNYPYLVKIAKTRKPVIMSTGMAVLTEINEAINVMKKNGTKDITLLHCTTDYPAPYETVNLNAMVNMGNFFEVPYGYSDHTKGIEVSVAAVAMGASVIEKHFTLDKNMEGPDHKASLEPHELKQMIESIRNIEISLGSSRKEPSEAEIKNAIVARKSIVASCFIKKGDVFSIENITTKRPGNGISPMRWNEVLGLKAKRDFDEDELIEI